MLGCNLDDYIKEIPTRKGFKKKVKEKETKNIVVQEYSLQDQFIKLFEGYTRLIGIPSL